MNAATILESGLPIVDAHHHVRDRPGDSYLFPDLRADLAAGHAVRATVVVETRRARSITPRAPAAWALTNRAVVDARLRVHGVRGLRVIDASVMPNIVGANPNAATTMIGEKGAAMMLEDAM